MLHSRSPPSLKPPDAPLSQMSATINQKQFSDYFGGAPVVEIPG